jgi:hypothetical protein
LPGESGVVRIALYYGAGTGEVQAISTSRPVAV